MSVVLARSRPLRGGLAAALVAAVPVAALVAAVPVVAFGASALIASRSAPIRADPPAVAVAVAAPASSPHDCAGAQEDLVTATLAPEAIAGHRGGERMALAVDVHHHFPEPAAIVGAVEVIDDRGRRIGPRSELGARSLPARSQTAYRFETPDRLAGGYYRVQVSLLARAGGAEDFSTHQLYFHVAGGSLTPITSHDWLTRSASGLAFPAP
jgi:hypothetical protein